MMPDVPFGYTCERTHVALLSDGRPAFYDNGISRPDLIWELNKKIPSVSVQEFILSRDLDDWIYDKDTCLWRKAVTITENKLSKSILSAFKDEGMEGYAPKAWVFADESNDEMMQKHKTFYIKRKSIEEDGLKNRIKALQSHLKELDKEFVRAIEIISDGDGLWEITLFNGAEIIEKASDRLNQ